MKDLITLKAACDSVVNDPSLRSVKDASGKIVTTYCNVAAMRVARSVGCKELDGLMADQQYAVMDANKSGLWQKVPGCAAAAWAESGGLCFAAMTAAMLGEVHGHIAACYPGAMERGADQGRQNRRDLHTHARPGPQRERPHGVGGRPERRKEQHPGHRQRDPYNWLGSDSHQFSRLDYLLAHYLSKMVV